MVIWLTVGRGIWWRRIIKVCVILWWGKGGSLHGVILDLEEELRAVNILSLSLYNSSMIEEGVSSILVVFLTKEFEFSGIS